MKREFDFSIEIVILLVLAVFMLLFGFLLFQIAAGALPYSPDSTYGLFLVIVSFQIITMGKTPFGDFRRSWLLVAAAICTAIVGATACFIPGFLTGTARVLAGVMLLGGGLSLLWQLFSSEEKAKAWMRTGGILRQLAVACTLVYVLSIVLGVITLLPGIVPDRWTAVLLIAYGSAFAHLSWSIWRVRHAYPGEPRKQGADTGTSSGRHFALFRDASIPLSVAILILLGAILAVLGLFLFPVNLGLLPFSPDGQLGLMLTVMAMQTMSLGQTPLGQVERSWLVLLLGLAFAVLGAFSSIVPGVLTGMVTVLLGVLNLAGGGLFLARRYLAPSRKTGHRPDTPPEARKVIATQTALNWVAVVFGTSTLASGLMPGVFVAAILVVNGMLLFKLASQLLAMGTARVANPLAEAV